MYNKPLSNYIDFFIIFFAFTGLFNYAVAIDEIEKETFSFRFICDSNIEGFEYCPVELKENRYGELAAQILKSNENIQIGCEIDPSGGNCINGNNSFAGSVRLVISQPKIGLIEVKNIDYSSFNGNYSEAITEAIPTNTEKEFLNKTIELVQTIQQQRALSRYVYKRGNGTYENSENIPITASSYRPNSWSANDFPLACWGASDLVTSNNLISVADESIQGSCLTNIKSAVSDKVNSPHGLEKRALALLNAINNFPTDSTKLSIEKIIDNLGISITFADESRGLFDISLVSGSYLKINFNEDGSTLPNGLTLTEFRNLAENTADPFTRAFNFGDLVNFLALAGFGQSCSYDISGYRNESIYMIEKRPGKTATINIDRAQTGTIYLNNCSSDITVSTQ